MNYNTQNNTLLNEEKEDFNTKTGWIDDTTFKYVEDLIDRGLVQDSSLSISSSGENSLLPVRFVTTLAVLFTVSQKTKPQLFNLFSKHTQVGCPLSNQTCSDLGFRPQKGQQAVYSSLKLRRRDLLTLTLTDPL